MRKVKSFQEAVNDLSRFPVANWVSSLWFVLHILKYGPSLLRSIVRILRANLVKNEWITNEEDLLPIEVLIPCTEKDARTLNLVIRSVLENSLNEITKINIVCPEKELVQITAMVEDENFECRIEIHNERKFINPTLYDEIVALLGKRAGHAIQQIVKICFVASSRAFGILVLDSDTVILQPVCWLDKHSNQVLYLSWENTPEHYNHLELLCERRFNRSLNTVTHHMLMQPEWVREFMGASTENGINQFMMRAFELSNKEIASIFSLDYLFYGLNAIEHHRQQVQIVRWCNISSRFTDSVNRSSVIEELKTLFPYKSVSFHEWQN